jgi:ribonuclease HI
MMNHVSIYCDGACLGNPGPGGYAALLMAHDQKLRERVVCGYELSTTNNRMEIKAAIAGLSALKKKCRVSLYCDSLYVIKGMTEWMEGWIRSGWKTANNKLVKNVDLWQELVVSAQCHEVIWSWVKGHAGNKYNERVDEIAREQAGLAYHQLYKTQV